MTASRENIKKLCEKTNCTFKDDKFTDDNNITYKYSVKNHNNNELHRFKLLIEVFYYLRDLL